ncbi:MAG: bifunctional folylpolyglutamate synthase/dihydrofolate synthase, partial [Lachnospiraceae bacterium]|nr:bifunctional folylpolyglutamate synthase/dihydrofolate synthase [Lachnospiraceae bacterium]
MEQQEIMTRRQTENYIESLSAYGSVLGLENMKRLCAYLEIPLERLPIIHIAGTNGKGSTLAFVSTILKEAGYRVGRYLSPTVMEYRERIQIGGRMIPWNALCRYMTRAKQVCERIISEGYEHPTPFEIETALSFLYFWENNCDFIVLETGLGGSLDATNVIPTPIVSVLSSISMDHMAFLGDTLEKIADQKCGIIKEGRPVVSQMQSEDVLKVIRKVCVQKNAALTFVESEEIKKIKYGINKQRFSYKEYQKCEIGLAGAYQIENAALSLEVIKLLRNLGYDIPEKAVYAGLRNTEWRGRFEVISKRPLFIADGAHNEAAAVKLADSIRFYFTNKKIIYIMGVLKDKEYEKIIQHTYRYAEQIITIKTPGNPRAMDAYELAKEVSRYHPKVTMADSIEEAVEMA